MSNSVSNSGSHWISNSSARGVAEFLASKKNVLVITHVKPDGDAAGSALALARTLNARANANVAQVWFYGPLQPWIAELSRGQSVRLNELTTPAPPHALDLFDAIAIVDTGSWTQLEPLRAALKGKADRACIIDHHMQGDGEIAALRWIDGSAAAACQLVAALACEALGAATPDQLPKEIAHLAYLGLATDTGWFKHSNVNGKVMALAGQLIDAGAEHVALYRLIEQQDSAGRVRLMGRALAGLDMRLDGKFAMLSLNLNDFRECGAGPGESGGFTDHTQAIVGVEVSALLTEVNADEPGGPLITKVSLRSKESAIGVDVNAIAKTLGGGGHIRAAGARTTLPMASVKEHLTREVQARLRGS